MASNTTLTEQTTVGQIMASIIGISILLFSFLTLKALSRCSSMNKRIRILAQLLTISNSLFCVSIIITVVVNTTSLKNISFVCNVNFGLSRISVMLNIFVITLVVIDRYFCIHYPQKYLRIMTKKFLICLYIGAWLMAIVMSCISIPDTTENCAAPYKSGGKIIIISYMVCMAVIFVVYASIWHNIRRHIAKIRSLNQPVHFSGRAMYKSTLNITLVILIFMCCYLPGACYRLWLLLNPDAYYYTDSIRQVANFSFFIGIGMNPATYIWVFPQYRLEMMKMFCMVNKKKLCEIDRKIAIICAPFLEDNHRKHPRVNGYI